MHSLRTFSLLAITALAALCKISSPIPKAVLQSFSKPFKMSRAPGKPIEFVGNMRPNAGEANRRDVGDSKGLPVTVQVYQAGVTPGNGQGAGIQCFLHWGRVGQSWQDQAMGYVGDKDGLFPGDRANDEYGSTLATAKLTPGTYGFTTYCSEVGQTTKIWRRDGHGSSGLLTIVPDIQKDLVAPSPEGGVFVHLFEWKWTDIEKECLFLKEKGFTAVQVSPPAEHIIPVADMGSPGNDYPWWVRYQPVTHDVNELTSRSGSRREFIHMVKSCKNQGIDIYVDAVINHTTGVGRGAGTSGSSYTEYNYPQYKPADFHQCGTDDPNLTPHDIVRYDNRYEVQNCELVNLADLDLSRVGVRNTLRTYLQDLLDIGVAGFRIDAAKHIAASDINSIISGLVLPGGGQPYIFQEVIEASSEPIKAFEYTPNGDVTEFGYSRMIGAIFNRCDGSLSDLETFTRDFLPSSFAVVFTDNHDNQRGHGAGGPCILDHRDVKTYNLGNIFMLAFPYGYPKVMSSYYWRQDPSGEEGDSKGPPSTTPPFTSGSGPETRSVYGPEQVAGDIPENCSNTFEDGKWVCEHRRPAIANMVRFRAVTAGEPVIDWHNLGGERIAFGLGSKGFVIINNEESSSTHTFMTRLPSGTYCDVTQGEVRSGSCSGRKFTVDASGFLTVRVPPLDAIALHIRAMEYVVDKISR